MAESGAWGGDGLSCLASDFEVSLRGVEVMPLLARRRPQGHPPKEVAARDRRAIGRERHAGHQPGRLARAGCMGGRQGLRPAQHPEPRGFRRPLRGTRLKFSA